MTISEFKVVILGILILFINFRTGSLFENRVSISYKISLNFQMIESQNYVRRNMCVEDRS